MVAGVCWQLWKWFQTGCFTCSLHGGHHHVCKHLPFTLRTVVKLENVWWKIETVNVPLESKSCATNRFQNQELLFWRRTVSVSSLWHIFQTLLHASSSQLFADQLVFTDHNGNLLVATKFSWLHYISLVTSGCQMVSRAVWLEHYLESTEAHASLLDSCVLYDFIIGTAGGTRGKVWGITSIFSNLPVGIMTVFNFKTWAIKTNKLKLSSYKTDCKCQCL